MGRSVITASGATAVAYRSFGPDEEYYREIFDEEIEAEFIDEDEDFDTWMHRRWESDAEFEWEHLTEWIRERVTELWPSFEKAEGYDHRDEQATLAENSHSIVTISEYCGSVAISLAAKYDRAEFWQDPSEIAGLGEQWRKKISDRFERELGEMTLLGRFSDGTSVYQKI